MRRILLVVALLAGGACSSDGGRSSDDVASLGDATKTAAEQPQKDREKAFLEFARCMRAHGVDMPDPEVDGGGGVVRMRRAAGPAPRFEDGDTFEAAHKACKHHVEGIDSGPAPVVDPEIQDRMVKFAQCMREQGIDMPDPKVEGGRTAIQVQSGDRDKVDAAHKACEHLAPMPGGPGVQAAG